MKKLLLIISIFVFVTSLCAQTKNAPTFTNADAVSVVNFDAGDDHMASLPEKIAVGKLYFRIEGQGLKLSISPLIDPTNEERRFSKRYALNGQAKNFYLVGDMLTLEVTSMDFEGSILKPLIVVLKLSDKDRMGFISFQKSIPISK